MMTSFISGKKTRVWTTSISFMAAIGLVHGQIGVEPPISTGGPTQEPSLTTSTSTTISTSSTTTTTTTITTISPTISITPSPTLPSSSTSATPSPSPSPPPPPATSAAPSSTINTNTSTSTSTSSVIVVPTSPSSSSTSSSNLPVIVGSVAGAAALIIIIATAIICLRRKKRNNRDLTFDVLEGMNAGGAGAATSSRARQSQQHYRANALPTPALPPNNINTYEDDGYDYDNQVGAQGYGGHQGYDDTGYDAYGNPHHAYQNPSIFQEDSMAYSTANAISARNRQGYDQNLPEIVYRNGNDLIHPSGGATGYYEDDLYSQQIAGANNGWDHQNAAAGGYIGPKGLWIANPTNEKQYQQQQQPYQDEMELQPPLSSSGMTYEKNSITQYDSDTAVDSSSPPSKFRGHNPQALPESPRLQQLRGGDLFGQDGGSPSTPTSPRPADANVTAAAEPTRAASPPLTSGSPRLMSRAEMRSFEMTRHSPGRSSSEGAQSYADDLPSPGRPSVSDRPSMEGGGGSNLNPNKSLRTLRREDWS
ncbi:hypothetical protein EC957_004624 [Mortierella hygrophila]|uniref:Uncharacterized protein n=1 Tax=Mortierella hygrophila TaxID=979708 RepID=A0A9P6F1B6_9FUNG|nr:hypothetical protein EC957_004624 [Mortierella hygrophila]